MGPYLLFCVIQKVQIDRHDNFIVGEGENMGMHEGTVYIAYAICMQAL